ncbi:unnamed protein product [Camellia sinensis]
MYNKNTDYLYTVRIGSNPELWSSIRNQFVNYEFLILQSGTEPWIQKINPNLSDWTGLDRITDLTDSLLSPILPTSKFPQKLKLKFQSLSNCSISSQLPSNLFARPLGNMDCSLRHRRFWSLWSEKTKIGSMVSAALVSTLVGLGASNMGIIPYEASAYSIVLQFLLPLTVPLLLFKADLRHVVRSTGPLLLAFLLGSG